MAARLFTQTCRKSNSASPSPIVPVGAPVAISVDTVSLSMLELGSATVELGRDSERTKWLEVRIRSRYDSKAIQIVSLLK